MLFWVHFPLLEVSSTVFWHGEKLPSPLFVSHAQCWSGVFCPIIASERENRWWNECSSVHLHQFFWGEKCIRRRLQDASKLRQLWAFFLPCKNDAGRDHTYVGKCTSGCARHRIMPRLKERQCLALVLIAFVIYAAFSHYKVTSESGFSGESTFLSQMKWLWNERFLRTREASVGSEVGIPVWQRQSAGH